MDRCAVILCTRNRPREVLALVEQLAEQTLQPCEVLVVDSSDTDELVDHLFRTRLSIRYLHTEPGLTRQRNVGLESVSSCDYVLFLDDDVSLPDSFVEAVVRTFLAHPKAVGVGARTSDNPITPPRLLERLMMLDSQRSGRLLRSGVNVPFRDECGPYPVDWLPGCAMAYRLTSMTGMSFDESRLGVGWGEDVDFSARMAARGQLIIITEPQVVHAQSPIGRDSIAVRRDNERSSRARLAADRVGRVRPLAVLYGSMFLASRDDLMRTYFALGRLRRLLGRSLRGTLVGLRATRSEVVLSPDAGLLRRAPETVCGRGTPESASASATDARLLRVETKAGRVSTEIDSGGARPSVAPLSNFGRALTCSAVKYFSEPIRFGFGAVSASFQDVPLTYRELRSARRRPHRLTT